MNAYYTISHLCLLLEYYAGKNIQGNRPQSDFMEYLD